MALTTRIRQSLSHFLAEKSYTLRKVPRPLIARPEASFICALDFLLAYQHLQTDDFFFIQVGAFDGVTNDPIHKWVKKYGWRGILLEPQPHAYALLQRNYADQPQLVLKNAAIADKNGEKPFYRFGDDPSLPEGFQQLASFSKETLLAHVANDPTWEAKIIADPLPCLTFNTLLDQAGANKVDLLLIDAEGYDYELLKMFDFKRVKPAIIQFEFRHLGNNQDNAVQLLIDQGYRVTVDWYDAIAYRADLFPETPDK